MSELTRDSLKGVFKNGDRPQGRDFENLIDSCVNKATDRVSVDTDGNLVLSRGVRLGDSNGTDPGGLRFNNNQLQIFTGGAWVNVSGGGGGVFQLIGPGNAAFHPGFVGLGQAFATAPTFRLEVPLDANNGPGNQVRFGNAVIANGTAGFATAAVFSHQGHASNSNFALRQATTGAVHLNAPTGQIVSIRQGGATARLAVSTAGNVIVGSESELANIPNPPGTAVLQVSGDAFKSTGNANWLITSDARLKDDVRDLEAGLSELRRVRTVRFRYNGRAGTSAGADGVGVIGQEIETIFPETIKRGSAPGDPGLADLRVFDSSMLTYVLINAVKELAARVERLEQALAAPVAAPSPA
jgi:hypothetical protein